MSFGFTKSQISLAVAAALGAATVAVAPRTAGADPTGGTYLTGDFHNHTTCSDGSISMQKLVKKATDTTDTPWGLDWFVQAGHGGNGNRNCTLAEDATLATPAYPLVKATDGTVLGPSTTWQSSNPAVQPKGLASGTAPAQNLWRWQSLQEYQYPLLEYLSALRHEEPLFLGVESVVAGHEHSSMSVISGQMPASIFRTPLPTGPGYSPLGNATALSQWEYCFDRGDTDTSRGNTTVGGTTGNNWDCSVAGSLNASDPSWNTTAAKLVPASGVGNGTKGHLKTVEAMRWMAQNHPNGSYYVPAHLERAGPFNPDGNNGYNIEHLRNFNNVAPRSAFGMETQPGHGASDARGEYTIRRNQIGTQRVDSVGGTTYGGTGVYGAQIGGVWDALLGEGRNFWFFASSDWHNRGLFGPDDRRTSQDFYPGEYQRDYVMVSRNTDGGVRRRSSDPETPQDIVDGLRTGNSFAASGQLIDRLGFLACVEPLKGKLADGLVESATLLAAAQNTDADLRNCATMGQKLVVPQGSEVIVAIAVRDPDGKNWSPYTFANPSLKQIGVTQPLNEPVLDHFDVIRGMVTGYKTPGSADYSGQWPSDWLDESNPGAPGDLSKVPAGAKNTSAKIYRTYNSATWKAVPANSAQLKGFKIVTFRLSDLKASQYLRLRGSNLPAAVPYETDAEGNPLADLFTNAAAVAKSSTVATDPDDSFPANAFLKIPCTAVGTNVPQTATAAYTGTDIDGCPAHLPTVNGQKMAAFDVAAWADLWFYSNPIYIEVKGSTPVAGVE